MFRFLSSNFSFETYTVLIGKSTKKDTWRNLQEKFEEAVDINQFQRKSGQGRHCVEKDMPALVGLIETVMENQCLIRAERRRQNDIPIFSGLALIELCHLSLGCQI